MLISIDTLRADALACYGGDADVGLAMCRLAERGFRVDWAFATAPSTGPSAASILTSRYPSFHGVTRNTNHALRDELTTLAEVLGGTGYATAAFVSNPALHRSRALDQGFAVYDHRMTRRERNRPLFREREAAATTDAALDWAASAPAPWFLWVHYQDPHGPYDPPGSAIGPEAAGATPLPLLDENSGYGGIPAYQALDGLSSLEAYRRRYRDEVRYADAHVERLVAGVDALGDPPGLILTADHGEAFGEDGYYFAHGHSVALDQIRIPLLGRLPPGSEARPRAGPASLVDVAPTLLAMAGIGAPAAFQGRSLLADAEAPDPVAERVLFAEHAEHAAAIAGDAYYARPRGPSIDASDPRSVNLPPRTARLSADRAVGYAPVDTAAGPPGLESALDAFLQAADQQPEPIVHELSDEMVERMRALGYLD